MSSLKVGARSISVSSVATGLAYIMFMKIENQDSMHNDRYLRHMSGNTRNGSRLDQRIFHSSVFPVTNCEKSAAGMKDHLDASSWKGGSVTRQMDSSIKTVNSRQPGPLSRTQRILHYCGLLRSLHTPRLLTKHDPVFDYPQMKKGLKQRIRDEKDLRNLQTEAIEARQSQNPDRIQAVFMKISNIAYGMSPQQREEFLMMYGCSAWTEEILNFIVDLSKDRGIVEIGAGNGQWARAIHDRAKNLDQSKTNGNATLKDYDDFILAFDNMKELPLSPKIYHSHTQPAHDYFYKKVQSCSSHIDAARRMSSRGRVLLLVYPPPGSMAVETIKAYVDVYPQGNDTVVYVGEGRGGANGNDDLFNYFCDSGEWILTKVMDVQKSIKGYERCFCFQRMNKKE